MGGEVLVDLTSDTVTPENLDEGITAHNSAGEQIVGSREPLGQAAYADIANNLTTTQAGLVLDARQGKQLYDQITQVNTAADSIDKKLGNLRLVKGTPYTPEVTVDFQLPNYGIYLVVIQNRYGAGGLWLAQSGDARQYPKIDFIAGTAAYFKVEGVQDRFTIRITRDGASIDGIRIYAL